VLTVLQQQLNNGTRDQFLTDCRDGVYEGVLAISRTYDSTQVKRLNDLTSTCAERLIYGSSRSLVASTKSSSTSSPRA